MQNGNKVYTIHVRMPGSPYMTALKVEAYSPNEAERIVRSMHPNARIMNPPFVHQEDRDR